MEKRPSPYDVAKKQFDQAADLLELGEAERDLLRHPSRELYFSIPVQMDDGKIKIIRGFRVQHNDARGPGMGGIRFHPKGNLDTIRAQSMWMTWKCAVTNIPLGGSVGGFLIDPRELSLREQEQLCRGWVRQIAKNIGPMVDVPYPDLMSNSQHMLWMLDEYEVITGKRTPGFITGKPVGMGGSRGRTEATGYGVILSVREALKELGIDIRETRASVQGFGNVGQYAIQLYKQMGGNVICVASWDQENQSAIGFKKETGIILDELKNISNYYGEIDKYKAQDLGYELLPGESWLEQDVDILIPAALGQQISKSTVEKISTEVKIIAEGAIGPTTPWADKLLDPRGIHIIPDLLASAGGVICSYYEHVQSLNNYYWQKSDVLGQLDVIMTSAYYDVSDFAKEHNIKMRDAAIVMAVDRVAKACRDRGWV